MKKRRITAAAIAVLAAFPAVLASAADIKTYEPSLYFKASDTEDVTCLVSGNLFVNVKDIPEGKKIKTDIFYLDEMKATNQLYIKWQCDSKDVRINNLIDPVTSAGACPFSKWKTADSIPLICKEESNYMAVSYSTISSSPLELTGESSDSYPAATFDIELPADVPVGRYEVKFLTGEGSNICSASYSEPLRDIRPSGDNAKSLFIGVSDRALGDVNGSGKLEASDASKLLVAYTFLSANEPSDLTLAEEIAGDLNGDGKITAADASAVLVKYADGQ